MEEDAQEDGETEKGMNGNQVLNGRTPRENEQTLFRTYGNRKRW